MKAGIFTLQESDNYGAVLQAYALQTFLKRIGVESEFVIFEKETVTEKAKDPVVPLIKKLRMEEKKRSLFFDDFRGIYLKCSIPFPRQNAEDLNDRYDLFIAGSDQVWNLSIPGVDGRYFLPFVDPCKRFSYAASFGRNHISENTRNWCAQQLKKFQAISVREERGRKIIKECTGRDSVVCLDPVFLLERTEWEKLTSAGESVPYVLLYFMQYNKELMMRAQNAAEAKGLKLRIVTASFMQPCGFDAWSGTGVTDWLSLIKNAEYVYTNSFHGIAFSMIFERSFSAIRLDSDLEERNGRIEELLNMTGMEDCMNGNAVRISEPELTKRLEGMKRASVEYLKKAADL